MYLAYPVIPCVSAVTAVNAVCFMGCFLVLGMELGFYLSYVLGVHIWLGIFVCGMLTHKLFELNQRGKPVQRQAGRRWFVITDSISLLLLGTLIFQSLTAKDQQEVFGHLKTFASGCQVAADCNRPDCQGWKEFGCDEDRKQCWRKAEEALCAGKEDLSPLRNGVCYDSHYYENCSEKPEVETNVDFASYPVNVIFGMVWSRPLRFCTPVLCLWVYGLARGRGFTARLMGSNFMVKYLSPAAYPMYLFHFPIGQYMVLIKRAMHAETMPPGALLPMEWWEFFIFVGLTTALSGLAMQYLNGPATALFEKWFDKIYCCCSCICGPPNSPSETQPTLLTVVEVISGLTGSDVDGTTRLMEAGLDSFGASSLVGRLRAAFPSVHLVNSDIYRLQTVGELASHIDQQIAAASTTVT